LDNPQTAAIMINNITGTTSQITPIANISGYIQIDVTSMQTGTYNVILICDGVSEHSKILIIN